MEENKTTEIAAKILVVDDDPAVLKVIRKALEGAGYQVLEAKDGKSAVALITQGPDLVLQDLLLPDIAGYDLVVKLRARSEEKPVPILAMSGYLTEPDEEWVKSSGYNGMIRKPVKPSELVEAVKTWLSKNSG